jgi:hypothetical protein
MEGFLFKKIELWLLLLILVLGTIGTVFFGAAVRSFHMGGIHGPLVPLANEIASIPSNAKSIFKGQFGKADLEPKEQRFKGESGFLFNYHPGERPDLGYLLLNRYDFELGLSVSELVDLNTQETLHQWKFDVDPLWQQSKLINKPSNFNTSNSTNRFRNIHSFLLKNGTIVDSKDSPFFSVDLCSKPTLVNDKSIFHHSIETDHQGNFWIPKHFYPKTTNLGTDEFLDDGITQLSPDGTVLFEKPIVTVLDENELGYMIYGMGKYNDDPIHLNDIQPVLADGPFWKIGDVFLSLRNLSMIILYRPSNNKIIWHKEGPWLHQHDVDILDDHRIAVFDNNSKLHDTSSELIVDGANNEYIFDFTTEALSSPFDNAFKSLEIRTPTEGRGEIINPNEIFVEETNFGRLIQFNKTGEISWQFINRASNGKVYYVSWSRLISRSLGDQVRNSIKEKNCQPH